jgi:hypothetical protein
LILSCVPPKKKSCGLDGFVNLKIGDHFSINLPERVCEVVDTPIFRLEFNKYSRFDKQFRSIDSLSVLYLSVNDYTNDWALSVELSPYLDYYYGSHKSIYHRDSVETLYNGIETVGNKKVGWFGFNGIKKGEKTQFIGIVFFMERIKHEVLLWSNVALTKEDIENCIVKSIKEEK